MYVPLMQDCSQLLLDSTNAHNCNSTDRHSSFLANVQQERALECGLIALNNTHVPEACDVQLLSSSGQVLDTL